MPLGDVIREAQVGFASGDRDPQGVIQLRMNNVDRRGGFDWSSITRVPADSAVVRAYALAPGDVLFNNTNSVELVGKSALFEGSTEPVVFSNHFTRLRPAPGLLAPEFLALWLRAEWGQHVFADICNRWVGQAAVQRDKLLALRIPLAPVADQRRIAALLAQRLTIVERARVAAEAQLVAAAMLPVAHLRSAFDANRVRQFPVERLGSFAQTCSGATPARGRPDYYDGPIPWVKTGELRDGFIDDAEEHVSHQALHETSLRLLPAGALLIAMYGQGQTRGRTGLLRTPAVTNQACFAVLPNPSAFDPQYLQLWFRYRYARLRSESDSRGGSQPNLNGELLRGERVPLPEVREQRRLAAKLSSQIANTERLSAAIEQQIGAVNQMRGALLRDAFNGEH